MAQATNPVSWCAATISVSTNCSDYTDVSGFANSITVDGGDRQSGEEYTFDGDTAIITAGPREPLEVTARMVYDESDASSPLDDIIDSYEEDCGGDFSIKWTIADSGSDYETSCGFIVGHPYSSGEKSGGAPAVYELRIKCASITKS